MKKEDPDEEEETRRDYIRFADNSTNKKHKPQTQKSHMSIQLWCLFVFGILSGFGSATWLRLNLLSCSNLRSCCPNGMLLEELLHDNQFNSTENNVVFTDVPPEKSLVFVGVMTAQKYLDTRARAVYETWGRKIPGRISFFSRSGSSSKYDIPLVSLPGVDDSYPPQKKSFMMLKFIHDNYLDKFEWFMRVDDDVYIKEDKLEKLLRRLNSSVPQFIGQAGLGNKDEFGQLSLDYDENFCMGGPGIVMSRETLKRVVPHISYCLKNLFSTHEDVEVGRCVRKFANISCTWTYEMQHIFHHNSSGSDVFTGNLLTPENMRATSLHPIKKPKYLYRMHNFFNQRKILDLRQQFFNLERKVFKLKNQLALNVSSLEMTTELKALLRSTEPIVNERFLGKPSVNDAPNPARPQDRHDFDFFTRSLFASTYISPKRRLEGYWQASIFENLRQIMNDINSNGIERGRIIDYKDTLYGYVRNHPLVGLDYILDILLIYKKYEGRKMTVPVRRHAYVRNSYVTMLYREDPLDSSIFYKLPEKYEMLAEVQKMNMSTVPSSESSKSTHSLFKRILNLFNGADQMPTINGENSSPDDLSHQWGEARQGLEPLMVNDKIQSKVINFVVPLTGRWEVFVNFMRNYEEVCLKSGEKTRLVVVLFENEHTEKIGDLKQSQAILEVFNRLKKDYDLKDNKQALNLLINTGNFSRSIGCEQGAATFSMSELIFFVDVDMAFSREFLLRARLNTIESKQVYYPIVFSEYNPDQISEAFKLSTVAKDPKRQKVRSDHYGFDLDTGYWRNFGFGILATYNSDLKRVGGFNKSIVGWGKEDVDLYEKFIKSELTIFRTVDPGLVHVFHRIECDPGLNDEQMLMCIGSKATSIASQRVLADLIFRDRQKTGQEKRRRR